MGIKENLAELERRNREALLAAAEQRLAVPVLELGQILLDSHASDLPARHSVLSMRSPEIQGCPRRCGFDASSGGWPDS